MRGANRLWHITLLILAASPAAQAFEALGRAFDQSDGHLLYSEHYQCQPDATRCTVDYQTPGGETFAYKRLNYGTRLWAPSVQFEDYRLQERVTIDASAHDPELVIDAGFDHFVRQHWAVLSGGETVHFRFLPTSLSKAVSMRATLDARSTCEPDQLCLRVEPDSWLIRWIGGAIRLVYSKQQRRLLEFAGTSNIPDARGNSQEVRILYHYEPPSAPGQGRAAARQEEP